MKVGRCLVTTIRIQAILLTLLSLACADLGDPSAKPDPTFARGRPGGGPTTLSITLTDIVGLQGSTSSRADGINSRVEVVGTSMFGSEPHAFYWREGGLMVDLDVGWALDVSAPLPPDVSAGGRVAGAVYHASTDQQRAVVWEQGRPGQWTATELPVVDINGTSFAGNSFAYGIDSTGDRVAGSVSQDRDHLSAALWTKSDAGWNLTELLFPAGASLAYARKVNDAGVIIGGAHIDAPGYRGVVWTNNGETVTMLDRLPGAQAPADDDGPLGINARGDIVGSSYDANRVRRAVVWRRAADGGWSAPDVMGETRWSRADADGISDDGNLVVGYAATGPYQQVGFLWDSGTRTTTLLKTRGGTAAFAINGRRIVGSGYDGTHAVMWTVN